MRNVRGAFMTGRHDTGRQDGEASEGQGKGRAEGGAFSNPLWSFLPVSLVLLLVIALRIELHIALALTIVALFLFYRVGLRDIGRSLRYELHPRCRGPHFRRYAFQNDDGEFGRRISPEQISGKFGDTGTACDRPAALLSGILTGITVGFVGSTFPLLISLAGGAHLNEMTLAFASVSRRAPLAGPPLPRPDEGVFQGRHLGDLQEDHPGRVHRHGKRLHRLLSRVTDGNINHEGVVMGQISLQWCGEDSRMFIGRDSHGGTVVAGSWQKEKTNNGRNGRASSRRICWLSASAHARAGTSSNSSRSSAST
ncbi:MAG: hypothetical protein MZV70_59415 [Desulfobacterales bacterium]|nr:hypothetical protein [Desulfobacterales bacterium]